MPARPGVFRQLTLEFALEPRFGVEDFLVSNTNEAAYGMVERWPDWPDPVVLFLGPTGAGKSHLAAIWAARAGARTLSARTLHSVEPPELASAGAVVIEDADQMPRGGEDQDEAKLFHLLNLIRERQSFLVVTARTWPANWGVDIPDLLSRLRLAPAIELGEPDDALVRAVLVKLFVDRQLVVDTSVIDYIALRIERSLDAARIVVEALDREALSLGRRITRPMAGEILRRLEGAPS